METILKALILAQIVILATDSIAIGLSIGWLTYFYLANKESKKMTKQYEPVVVKSFWRKYNEEQIQAMSDEEVMQIVDAHLEQYIVGWQKRNKGKDLPDLAKSTIADVRNKRTKISKAPKIVKS